MSRKNRISLILIIYLCSSVLMGLGYVAMHTEHECVGPSCQICERIEDCVEQMKRMGTALVGIISLGCLYKYRLCLTYPNRYTCRLPITLVGLKVRLDH